MLWLTVCPHFPSTQNVLRQAFKLILTIQTLPWSQSDAGKYHQFESLSKSITQKGNAHLGLGQFDEAKECYESLRTLGQNSAADRYLKKLSDAQERDQSLFSSFLEITKM